MKEGLLVNQSFIHMLGVTRLKLNVQYLCCLHESFSSLKCKAKNEQRSRYVVRVYHNTFSIYVHYFNRAVDLM